MFATKQSPQEQKRLKSDHLTKYTQTVTVGDLGSGNVPNLDAMDLTDLKMCYIVFSKQKPEEIPLLCYEIMKVARDQDAITLHDFEHFASALLSKDKKFVADIYRNIQLDPRIPITRDEFVGVYPKIRETGLFAFVHDLADGFKREHLNYDSGQGDFEKRPGSSNHN